VFGECKQTKPLVFTNSMGRSTITASFLDDYQDWITEAAPNAIISRIACGTPNLSKKKKLLGQPAADIFGEKIPLSA
jgi:hypothetical protein